MGGGYLNHNKKNYSERRNHGLSLTNLTHCISPSEYCDDYYNNDSFNKINLQLHASSVSNPYSFSIKSNTGFGGSVQAALPTTETELLSLYSNGTDDERLASFRVPNKCKIIKVIANWTYTAFLLHDNKLWMTGYGDYDNIKYIGVTPGKDYTVKYSIDKINSSYIKLTYSAEINTHTPDIKDY